MSMPGLRNLLEKSGTFSSLGTGLMEIYIKVNRQTLRD